MKQPKTDRLRSELASGFGLPQLYMPHAWEFFSDGDQEDIIQGGRSTAAGLRGAASARRAVSRIQSLLPLAAVFRIKSEHLNVRRN